MSSPTTRAVLALAGSEVRLLVRNRLVAFTALLIPLATAAGFAATDLRYGDGGAGGTVAFMVLTMLLLTVYISVTTAVASRRSGLVLKRLRSGETPEWAILAGLLLPTLVLSVVQSLLIAGMFVAFGAALPEHPAVVFGAAVAGALVCAAFALATTRVTASAETAQVTTMPFFFAALAGAFWIVTKPVGDATTLMMINPGGAIMQLMRGGWDGGGDLLPAAGALVVWIVLGYEVAKRTFRWEPRV